MVTKENRTRKSLVAGKPGAGLVSVGDVSRRYGVSSQQVLRAIRSKKLRASKIGWFWVIDEKDLPASWSDL